MRKILFCLLVLSGCRQAEAPIDTVSVNPPIESAESTTEEGASIEKRIGLDAEEVFATALATASNEGKNVFVHLGGPG